VRGWERAIDAQLRIRSAVARIVAEAPKNGDLAVISHGGVGALLLCYLKGVPISRAEDQPGAGGGCVHSLDMATNALLSDWRMFEDESIWSRPDSAPT
jgi:broad specificity phosphatase PhoE